MTYERYVRHLLGEYEALRVLREFERHLPLTTFLANWKTGREPFLARLDLAVNFSAPIGTLVEAYRVARHPQIRKKADTYGSTGWGLYGSGMDIVLYSTEAEPRRSKLRRKLEGKRIQAASGGARLEIRYKTARAVGRALQEMKQAAPDTSRTSPILPCMVADSDRVMKPAHIPFENHELHRQAMREVLRLAGGRSIKIPDGEGDLLRRLAIKHLAEHPELMPQVEATYCKKTAALQLRDAETGLVRLAWPRPQARTRGQSRTKPTRREPSTVHPTDTVSVRISDSTGPTAPSN
ncbi:MAG: hypothetical protein AAF368_10655 [Planctomycetota bacterium]